MVLLIITSEKANSRSSKENIETIRLLFIMKRKNNRPQVSL